MKQLKNWLPAQQRTMFQVILSGSCGERFSSCGELNRGIMGNHRDDRPVLAKVIDNDGVLVRELKEGDRIIDANSSNAARSKKIREREAIKSGEKQEWNLEHFFKGHIPEIRGLMKSLSTYDRAFLFSIATYVGYEDCCLKFDNGKVLDFEDLVDISGMSRGKLSEVLIGLRNADIIYKGTNSKGIQYFVNPWIFCKGVRINAVLRTMFKNYHIRVLGGKQWGIFEKINPSKAVDTKENIK